ncbi:Nitrous oxide reductase transcription regulator [gamma proteobacterium HdN1]|nr:Nitrous oxide reductase transcription regulator [gamma proteobacterium HdN1]
MNIAAAWLVALVLSMFFLSNFAYAGAYEAKLAPELFSDPDMCRYTSCQEVLPGATRFTVRKGQPPYVEGWDGEGANAVLKGYVMLSTDITDTPAYSGKPVITLIGMDTKGNFTGAKVLKHSEPILLLGIPESALTQFLDQYTGKFVGDEIEIGNSSSGATTIDGISGATVTVIAENQVLTTSGMAVARQAGIIQPDDRAQAELLTLSKTLDWATLVKEGSVQRLQVTNREVGLPNGRDTFIELWFGYLNAPDVGRAILGDMSYDHLMKQLKPGEHALFVVRTAGKESFKGSGFVRGGLFDRIQVRQGHDMFTFRDKDSLNLYGIHAEGAPHYNESGIFIIRSPAFSAAYPWNFVFMGNKVDRETGARTFRNFMANYWLPAEYMAGGHPKIEREMARWEKIWRSRALEIGLFTAFLLVIGVVYSQRHRLTRASTHKKHYPVNAFKYTGWVISIFFVGGFLMAQPSITQVLTWFHSLLFQWTWDLFLSDPFIFIFWIFIIATVFLWGRGLFCGWLCPFGSASELLYKLARLTGLKRFQTKLSVKWHDRLKWVKYGIFFGLLGVSLFSMELAEQLAEIEPFKTTFLIGILERGGPYAAYAAALLGLSLFIERPFCKYLCPLGASLAIPSTFRWFGLPRKEECNTCKACGKGCGSLAIDDIGRIDPRECLLCLDCLVLYTDDEACPPLASERKVRTKAGLPMTAINVDGYFEPVPANQIPAGVVLKPKRARIPMVEARDPRMPSPPAHPPYPLGGSAIAMLWAEFIDHVWPWRSFDRSRFLGGLLMALVPAIVFGGGLALAGNVQAGMMIGGWSAWCLFEVIIRMGSKPYVKEGPWWQHHYRKATTMDMISYVGFKNLLAGATVFLVLKYMGIIEWGIS